MMDHDPSDLEWDGRCIECGVPWLPNAPAPTTRQLATCPDCRAAATIAELRAELERERARADRFEAEARRLKRMLSGATSRETEN